MSVVRKSLLHLVLPTIAITGITVFEGATLFGDSLPGQQFLVPLLVSCFVVFVLSKRVTMRRDSPCGDPRGQAPPFLHSRISSWIAFAVFVGAEVGRSLLLRISLQDSAGIDQFFVAICLRSLYFSAFFLISAVYFFQRRRTLQKSIFPIDSKQIRVVLITSITFVCAFTISTPTFAQNLVVAPILFTAAQIMAFPLLQAYYCNGGTESSLLERLFHAFGKTESGDRSDRIVFASNVLAYVVGWSMCMFWIFIQFK